MPRLSDGFHPPEISNLIITRGPQACTRPLNLSHLSFHRVHQEDITQVHGVGVGEWALGVGHREAALNHCHGDVPRKCSPAPSCPT